MRDPFKFELFKFIELIGQKKYVDLSPEEITEKYLDIYFMYRTIHKDENLSNKQLMWNAFYIFRNRGKSFQESERRQEATRIVMALINHNQTGKDLEEAMKEVGLIFSVVEETESGDFEVRTVNKKTKK